MIVFCVTSQSQASNPLVAYLSISIPPLCNGGVLPSELSPYTIEMVKGLCPNVVEIAEPAREGFQLTLKLDLNQIPRSKGLFPLINLQYGWNPSIPLNYNVVIISDCKHFIHTIRVRAMATMVLQSSILYALVLLGFHFVNLQSDV